MTDESKKRRKAASHALAFELMALQYFKKGSYGLARHYFKGALGRWLDLAEELEELGEDSVANLCHDHARRGEQYLHLIDGHIGIEKPEGWED